MTAPTTSDILADLRTTREADQKHRLDVLLRYALIVGGALMCPVLVVAVAWGSR